MNLGDELEACRARNGRLTPEMVVGKARDPNHPLHAHFEWDDVKAGDKYRLDQARNLIRTIKLNYIRADNTRGEVRAFMAVRRPAGWNYEPADKVARDPLTAAMVAADMEREWRTFFGRYKEVVGFFDMVQASLSAPPPPSPPTARKRAAPKAATKKAAPRRAARKSVSS